MFIIKYSTTSSIFNWLSQSQGTRRAFLIFKKITIHTVVRGTHIKKWIKIDEERGNTKVSINKLLLHWMKWQIMHHNHVNEWLYYDMLFYLFFVYDSCRSTLVSGDFQIINNWRRQSVINWVNTTAYVVFIGMWLHRVI